MGNYKFYGVDTIYLAEKYGTPLYVMSEDHIIDRIKEIRKDFLDKYENTKAFYAGKAFLNKEIARIMKREGLGIDVVSPGELYTLISVDFPAENILLHGNSKTYEELEMAIDYGVGRIVVDSYDELMRIKEVAKNKGKVASILFRINPGVTTDTHKYVQTGQTDSKFGIPTLDGQFFDVFESIINEEYIDFKGLHFHIGSQLFGNGYYANAIENISYIINEINQRYNIEVKELNTGGGYGIQYNDNEERKPLYFYINKIMDTLDICSKKYGYRKPLVMIEPGRWMVGEAGITIYNVESIKEIGDIKTYLNVDGSMADNPRPSLYNAEYKAIIGNKYKEENEKTYTVAGRCCESGDLLVESVRLPIAEIGDKIIIFATGAYNFSMASSYNRLRTPAMVMIKNGEDRIVVNRQSYEDLIKNDI